MATRKRPTKPTHRGSSGGGNPRNDGRITEEQHDDAMRVLRAEYFQSVRSLAEEVVNQVKEDRRERDEVLHEVVDGSYWVIYTHANFQVLMCSDHHDAYSEDYGEPPVSGSDINWAALAYAALKQDVEATIGSDLDDLEERRRLRPREHSRPGRRPMHRRGR